MKKTSSDEPTGSENNETVFFAPKSYWWVRGRQPVLWSFRRGLRGPRGWGNFGPGAAGAFLAPVPGAVLTPELPPGPIWPRSPGQF